MPDYQRCLVLGVPRSGTSLCAAMIGSHPDVGMMQESRHHEEDKIFGVQVRGNKLCVPVQISWDPQPDDRSLLTRLEDGMRSIIGRPRCFRNPTGPVPEPPERQVTIQTYAEDWESCFIIMVRAPDHVIDSHIRRLDFPVERARQRWVRGMHVLNRVNENYGDRTVVLSFSELTSDPEPQMRKVAALLDIPFSDKMLEGFRHTMYYENDQIDSSKASREVQSYDVTSVDAEAVEIYNRMVQQSLN